MNITGKKAGKPGTQRSDVERSFVLTQYLQEGRLLLTNKLQEAANPKSFGRSSCIAAHFSYCTLKRWMVMQNAVLRCYPSCDAPTHVEIDGWTAWQPHR